MKNVQVPNMPGVRHAVFGVVLFVLIVLAVYVLIDWMGKRHEQQKLEQMTSCTIGTGTDRELAKRYVLSREKIQLDFQNCLRGNGNGNIELCEQAAYGISNLAPIAKDSSGDYMRDVITSVEICKHDVR